jgi:hypothetical protein
MCELAFNTAWERHGMCELAFNTAGERHGMCEFASAVLRRHVAELPMFGRFVAGSRQFCVWIAAGEWRGMCESALSGLCRTVSCILF